MRLHFLSIKTVYTLIKTVSFITAQTLSQVTSSVSFHSGEMGQASLLRCVTFMRPSFTLWLEQLLSPWKNRGGTSSHFGFGVMGTRQQRHNHNTLPSSLSLLTHSKSVLHRTTAGRIAVCAFETQLMLQTSYNGGLIYFTPHTPTPLLATLANPTGPEETFVCVPKMFLLKVACFPGIHN